MSARAVASKQMEISGLLQNFRPLQLKLEELLACEDAAIATLTANAVQPADYNDLNMHILQRKAIVRVFQLVEELREDLHPDEQSRE